MLKELITKRSKAIADMKSIRDLMVKEKRAELTEEEKAKLAELQKQLEDIKSQIAALEAIEKEEAEEAERSFKNSTVSHNRSFDGLANFLQSRSGSYTMNGEEFFKRAAVTSVSDPAFKITNTGDVIIDAGDTPLVSAIKPQFLPKGTLTVPLTKGLIGQIVGIGGSASDADPDSSMLNLAPKYYVVPLVVQDEFLASASDANINSLVEDAKTGLFRRMEQRAYELFSGATNATGSTAYAKVVNAEAGINGTGQYFLSSKATAIAKSTSVDSGSGVFVWNNGSVNGQPAHRAYLIGNNNNGFYVDTNKVIGAMWNEVKLDFIKDSTLAKAGQTLINVSVMADVAFAPSGVMKFSF